MSYIGQTLPADTFQGFVTDKFTGDGTANKTFTLSKTPFNESAILVTIDGVVQEATDDFTVSGTTLTLVGTAPNGSEVNAIHIGGALPIGQAASLDLNGASDQLILDADADTTISADTDDQIDFKAGGTDVMSMTATGLTINDGTTITTADNTDTLSLVSTDADANFGPNLRLYRNSASPADNDLAGNISFEARNDNSEDFVVAQMYSYIKDVSDGTEDGAWQVDYILNGSNSNIIGATTTEIFFNNDSRDLDFRVESDNNANALFVNGANGYIGLGTSSASTSYELTVHDPSNAQSFMQFTHSTSGVTSDDGYVVGLSGVNALIINYEAGAQIFYTNQIERMRLTSGGQLSIGASGPVGSSRLFFYASASTPYGLITQNNATTGSMYAAQFLQNDGSTELGSIKISNTATAFNTSSDYRLKENVVTDWDATTRLKQLKPSRFNFIADADTTVDGFLAHEVSSIVPEAISGDKDATETKTKVVVSSSGVVIHKDVEEADWIAGKVADEDGNTEYPTDSTWEASKVVPVYQGIDQSKLVPLMVKTIQELEARIKTLEDA
jgi:hypothetical protein